MYSVWKNNQKNYYCNGHNAASGFIAWRKVYFSNFLGAREISITSTVKEKCSEEKQGGLHIWGNPPK